MFLDESEYSCLGCHSKWSDDITDRLMMTLIVLLLVWCVVWELKSVLCSIRFRHNCVLCCDDVYWWNGMLWQCAGAFVVGVLVCGVDTVYVFWSYWGHVFWCGLVVFEKFVVVSAGWDIRVGAQSMGVRWCAWCCVSWLFFVFVSSSLFFWELWDHAFAFCFVTESLILAQDERWRRA